MSNSLTFSEIQSKLAELDNDSSISYLKSLLQTSQSQEEFQRLALLLKDFEDQAKSSMIDPSLMISEKLPTVKSLNQADSCSSSKQAEFDSFASLLKSNELQEGSLWHIISKSWLSSWESYLKLGSAWPGVISNQDLLEESEILKDLRPQKAYTNFVLKAGVQEKVHFELVPKQAYNFLLSRYGQDETVLKRWCISLAEDGSGLHVEMRLKPLNLVVLPCQQAKPFIVLVSRIETLAQVKEKIVLVRPELKKMEFRTWVLRGLNHFHEIKKNKKTDVKGKLLINEKLMIEECEIAENDLVVAEFKFNEDWLLFNSDQLCDFCKNSGNLRKCTACRSAKYCSRECQVNDYKSHKEVCWKIEKKEAGSGLVGFQNLGFTCFMNSALQCVLHCPRLKDYFLSGQFQQHLNVENPLGTKNAEMAKVFAKLAQVYWSGEETVIAPWSFKKVISKFSPQFIGYDQHDAHELLTFLLSGLHEDLNQILKKPYVERPEIDGLSDIQASRNSWDWFLLRNKSFIVDMMYGQLKSTLTCPKCSKQSVTFDPFLTLSVNIPNNKRVSFKVVVVNKKLELIKQKFLVFANTTIGKVKTLIMKKFKLKNLLIFYYNKEKVQGFCDENSEAAEYAQKKLIAYETPQELKGFSIISVHLMHSERSKTGSGFIRLLFFNKNDSLKKIHSYLRQNLPSGFKVFFINPTEFSGFFNKTKPPCVFCGSSSCEICPLPNSKISLEEIYEKIGNDSRLDLQIFYENKENCLKILEIQETEEISDSFILDDHFSLNHCINFTMNPETLDSENEWFCGVCKDHVQAQKTLQIYMLPKILVVHFVRFRTRGVFSSKNADFIDFPLNDFDVSSDSGSQSLGKYDLFAVVHHYGGLGGGHYTASVLRDKLWYCMDDSSVTQISHERVVNPSAYILFYKSKSLDA